MLSRMPPLPVPPPLENSMPRVTKSSPREADTGNDAVRLSAEFNVRDGYGSGGGALMRTSDIPPSPPALAEPLTPPAPPRPPKPPTAPEPPMPLPPVVP